MTDQPAGKPGISLKVALALGIALTGLPGCAPQAPTPERTEPREPTRTIALTFDDLPFAGSGDPAVTRPATDALLDALADADAAAAGFVVGSRVAPEGDDGTGRAILEAWLDGGHALENHSHTHRHYNDTDIPDYLADVRRGHRVVADVVGPRGGRVAWFRAPYNEVGDSPEKRAALLDALDGMDARLAPFTVEHSDYLFDAVYTRALAGGDTARAGRVLDAYVALLDTAMAFAEHLSLDTFGREIPQVLLLHANRINAAAMPAMIDVLRDRGYRFVSMDRATDDPAYDTPNEYPGRWGISWLHRWRVGLGLPNRLRDEPGPPDWVMEAYEGL